MRNRLLTISGAVTAALALTAPPAMSQAHEDAGAVPRTAWGRPDLQGVWDFRTLTPMERPDELAGKAVLTEAEAAEFERNNQRNQDNRETTPRGVVNGTPTNADVARAYNDFWWDFGKEVVPTRRTSLVVEPADGQIPALTPDAEQRAAARRDARERIAQGPEDRGVGERCLLGFNSGPPMVPSAYNNNVQILQTPDVVVLLTEMVHEARIVPLDGRPHLDGAVRQWVGDSRGRWEGDTLVIETRNFRGETAFQNSSENLHLVERFTRDGADTLLYEFTVSDPTTWTSAWTAQVPMQRNDQRLFEYACHEGNYGMTNLLSAARATEREAGRSTQTGSR